MRRPRPIPLENHSLELSRVLLDSAAKLHAAGDRARAREAYTKALMIYRTAAAAAAEPPRFARKFTEVADLLGIAGKPPASESRRPAVRKAHG